MKILKIYLDKKSSDNAVLDKAFYIEDGYQHGLASMVYIYKYIYIYIYVYIYIYIDKRSATSANKSAGTHTGTDINSNSDYEYQHWAFWKSVQLLENLINLNYFPFSGTTFVVLTKQLSSW